MVKKTKLQANELPVEDGLDIPNFEYNFGEPKDDRSPVHKILAATGRGVKDSFNDSGYIKRIMRASMPPVYGEVDDLVTTTRDNAKRLYNTAAKEIKPSVAELTRATEKLIPEGAVKSKATIKKIRDWAEDYKATPFTDDDKSRIRERNIALELADIFSSQAELQQSHQEENKADSKIKESLSMIQHRESQTFLGQINTGVSRLVQYQDKITQAYQRKTLELQYRSYFVGMESLEEAKRSNEFQKTTLLSIVKNTALPEYVKLKNSERFGEFARNKTIEALFGGAHGFINKAFTNVGNVLKEYTDVAKDAMFSATMAAENADLLKEDFTGRSLKENLVQGGVKGGLQYAGLKMGGRVRELLSKNKRVNKLAGDVKYGVTNLPELVTEYANSDNIEDGFMKSMGKSLLKDFIGNQKPDASLQADGIKGSVDPGMFSKYTNKSITEIIPGFLSRIFRELQIIRTGDENIKLTSYDIYSNKFMDSASLKKAIISRLIPQGAVRTHKETGKDIFDLIDPENKLSEEERSGLLDKLTKDKFDRKRASYERLTNSYTFASDPKLTGSASKIADSFERYFTNSGKEEKGSEGFIQRRNKLSSSFGQLGRFLNNPGSEIQNLINAGYYEQLRELGLIDDLGSTINMEEVLKRHNPEHNNVETNSIVSDQPSKRMRRRSTGVARTTSKDVSGKTDLSKALLENSNLLKEYLSSSKENQEKFDAFIESQKTGFENLNNAFKLSSSIKVDAVTTNDILLRIEDFLINKLKFIGSGNGNSGNSSFDPENQGYYKDSLLNNLRGLGRKAKSIVYDGFTKPLSNKIISGSKTILGSGFKTLGWGLKTGSRITNSIAEMLIKGRDIYVSGEMNPRLTKAGIKAGKYRDVVTGKIIKSIDDLRKLKGNVVDEEDNVVLKLDEIGNAFVKNIKGSGIVNLGGYLFGKAVDFSKFSSNAFLSMTGGIGKAVVGAKNILFSLIDQPIDIYIKGMDTPILLATIMRSGGYFSEKTGRPIMKPSEIDGPVKDSKGNYALTLDQMKQGLIDVHGKAIKTPLMKLFSAALGVAGFGIRTALKIGKMGVNAIKGGLNNTGEFFKGILEGLSSGIGGKKSVDILEQIRNILDDRLPKSNRKPGDRDGDGDRDGGWQDLLQNKKETEDDNSRTDATVKTGRENTFDRLARGVSSLKNKIGSLFGLGDDEDSDIDVDIDGPDRGGRRRRKRSGKLGKLGKLGRTGAVLGGAGKVLGKTGRLAAGALGWGGKALLTAGRFALPAAGAMIGGVASAAGTIASGVGAAATAIAGSLSLPVILGAAAIGLAGYGAYKLYKHLSKDKITPLLKLRMAQYGLTVDEEEYVSILNKMEQMLFPLVKYSDGQAELNVGDVLVPRLLELFNIDPESRDKIQLAAMQRWARWFVERFKPVFLTHLTAVHKIDPKQTLDTVDKMDPELKLKFLKAVSFREGPYSLLTSPFPELSKLTAGDKLVNYCIDEAQKAIEEEIKSATSKDTKLGGKGQTVAIGAVSASAVATSIKDPVSSQPQKPEQVSFTSKLMKFASKSIFTLANPFIALGSLTVKAFGPSISKTLGFGVNALEAVRFKAYGLVEMDRGKVIALRNLESEIKDRVKFNSVGSAVFNGSLSELLSKISSDFSIGGPGSKEANDWATWFGTRFLPVYLNFIGLLKQYSGSDSIKDEKSLKPSAQLEIAKKLVATQGIWNVTVSAWEGYAPNVDNQTVKENIKFLEESSAKDIVAEQKSSGKTNQNTKLGASTANAAASKQPATVREPGPGGTYERLPAYSKLGSEAPLANEGYRDKNDILAAKGNDAGKALRNTAPGTKTPRGNFSGFGEDIDTYIREASQMFGVDEKILRGFVKMEAGWTGKMSPTGAIGTGQFIQSTWDRLAQTEEGKQIGMTKIGNRFRTPNDPRYDKRVNTLATALLAKQNSEMLRKAGLNVTGEMLYMMHNIGPGVISAVKTGEVSADTLKAMQLNGMKSGMTPVGFVDYQKNRFSDHYAIANSISPQIAARIGRDGPSSGRQDNAAGIGPKPTEQLSNATPAGNSGSYMGSVENTKQNPSPITPPTFTQEQLPRERSPFKQSERNNIGGFNLKNNQPQPTVTYESNKAIVNVDKTLVESLTVQRQMLQTLSEISAKIDLETLVKLFNGSATKTEPKQESAPDNQQYTNARMNQSQTRPIARATVPMTRG